MCGGGMPCMDHGGKSLPKPKMAKGGMAEDDKMDMYAMDPDVPAMHGMAEGGEVDDELMDMAAGELLEAFEKKNKKQILESIKAIVLSCGE